ncbi:hypothetical protein AB0N29_01475 [Nocardioides sp. NPDC092400]|uniref:hypothetical protein n=1 Tax=Nocardioides sp. NPDC092400 TaxID=3155196 RepID=UPI0034231FC7
MSGDLPDQPVLSDLLEERLGSLSPPAGDPGRAKEAGRRLRRRRAAVRSGAAVVLASAVVAGGVAIGLDGGDGGGDEGRDVVPLGRLDFDEGLRAYADPGVEVHLGGRTFPADDLGRIDVDGAATPFGLVYYDGGVPMLLGEDGRTGALEPGAERAGGPVPTAKADSAKPFVAYGAVLAGRRTVLVRDLAADRRVAALDVEDRPGLAVDALDDGVVVLRDEDGTTVWDTATGAEQRLAGAGTRVADLRNGVLLYDGPPPDGPAAADYRLVPGAVDAQLTFDGAHVLSWSSTLRPTAQGGAPLVLDEGATGPGPQYGWWAVDTDGSVLTAVPDRRGQGVRVHDCDVPSGRCVDLGRLRALSGDPQFIGVDG